MQRDLDDTVIRPLRPLELEYRVDDSDTLVRSRRPAAERLAAERLAAERLDAEPVGPGPAEQPVPNATGVGYTFVVGSHQPIGLDRPAYLGRRPSPPRIAVGRRPRLVRVPSPLGEVSGTHLELRQEGTMVIATDLRTTNGTRVSLPGSAPVRLRQGESIVVTPGSLIEIGDGNVIEIQSLRRAFPPDPRWGATHS